MWPRITVAKSEGTVSGRPTVGYFGLDHHHCDPYLQSLASLPVEVTCAFEPDRSIGVDTVGPLPAGVTVYRQYDELFEAEDIDVAWITLSNQQTPAVITAAVDRGIDVYAEKPMARTAAELEPVAEAVRESNATVAASYVWRAHPIARELRRRAEEGFFGDVSAVYARFLASQVVHRDTDHHLFDAEASRGGILQWLGVHWVDLLPWILDDPITRVTASFDRTAEIVDVETGAAVQFETGAGASFSLQAGYLLREGRYDTAVDIIGTAGRSSWEPIGGTFGFDGSTELVLDSSTGEWASTPRRTITYEYESAAGYGGKWGLDSIRSFFDARTGDGTVTADIDDAVTVLRVLDAAYQSAKEDSWVSVDGQ